MKFARKVPGGQRYPLPRRVTKPSIGFTLRQCAETWSVQTVLALQRAAGNAAVSGVLTELRRAQSVSQRGSADERAADAVAETVVSGPEPARRPETGATAAGRAGTSAGLRTAEALGVASAGQPVPDTVRPSLEQRIGTDLGHVRLHTGEEASALAAGLGAKAFTYGQNIYFGAGHYDTASSEGLHLLAHEAAHTLQQDRTTQVMRAPGPLSAAQEADAIAWTTARYDERSIRIIQITTGSAVTGRFDDVAAQAVATFQTAAGGLVIDGKVGPRTLNHVIPNRAAADLREHAIQLVVDLNDLNATSDTLAVRFDPALAAARATTFEPGRLRIVRLGAPAFTNHATLRGAISAGLRTRAPAAPAAGARPAVLSKADEAAAVAANLARLADPRSARAVQGHTRSKPDGIWGPDTVQRVAQAQGAAGIPATGIVDEATVRLFTTQMIAAGNMNAPIRLIIDFFDIADDGNLLSVFFDATVATNASTDFRPNEPVRVRIGPGGMAQPFAGLVHTIAHEFEHVRRLREGLASRAVHEFLGEAVEILSVGMPAEDIESTAPGTPGFVPGFADDAERALDNWNSMTPAEQRAQGLRFLAVRAVVRSRIAAATPAQRALHAPLLAAYNAVVLPP